MSEEKQITRNQHYIPCCVLKYFKESDDVFNKKKKRIYHVIHNSNKAFPSTIENVMSAEFFYEHEKFPRNTVENQLEKFEVFYSKMLGEMIASIEDYKAGRLKFNEIKTQAFRLIDPIIRMHLRSGAIMYELNYWQERSRPDYSLFRMLDRFIRNDYPTRFAHALINFHEFCIIESSDKNFIVSDQFIATASLSFKARFMNATNRTIGMRDVIAFLPLSKSYYICFYNGNKPRYIISNKLKRLSSEQTNEVNKVIINNSYMQTAGPSFSTLKLALQSYIGNGPIAIYYGGSKTTGGIELSKEVFFYEKDRQIFEFVELAHNYMRYKGIQKNDFCPCGSGKPFGACCRFKVREFDRFMERIRKQDESKYYNPYGIINCNFHQENISEFHTKNS